MAPQDAAAPRLGNTVISIEFAHFGNKIKDYSLLIILLVFSVKFSCLNVAPVDRHSALNSFKVMFGILFH